MAVNITVGHHRAIDRKEQPVRQFKCYIYDSMTDRLVPYDAEYDVDVGNHRYPIADVRVFADDGSEIPDRGDNVYQQACRDLGLVV